MSSEDNEGCGCLITLACFAMIALLAATGVITLSCGGCYFGPAPKIK